MNALGEEFNNLVLDDVVEIEAENVCERVGAAATDEEARNAVSAKEELYIGLGSSTSGDFSRMFAGTFKVMRIANAAETEAPYGAFVKVTYAEDGSISNDGYTESTVLYRQTVEASNAVLVALKDTKVSDLATAASSVIDEMRLDEVMDVDGNVFTKLSTVPAEADKVNYYVLDHDMYIAYDPTNSDHAGATVFYKLRYDGSANAIIKKIATVKVKNMSDSIDVAIDNTYLRELIDIKVRSEFKLDELGEYVIFATFDTEEQARETYKGTYEIMEADGKVHVMVKYKDGLTGARYHLVSAASNSALANLSDVKVGKMSDGMKDVIDQMLLSEAMVINGDVFKAKTPADEAEKLRFSCAKQHVPCLRSSHRFCRNRVLRKSLRRRGQRGFEETGNRFRAEHTCSYQRCRERNQNFRTYNDKRRRQRRSQKSEKREGQKPVRGNRQRRQHQQAGRNYHHRRNIARRSHCA